MAGQRDLPLSASPPASYAAALSVARDALAGIGCELPRFEAEILMMHAAGWGRTALYRQLDEPAEPAVLERFQDDLRRRLAHEPAAYIIGRREFFGLDLSVDARVLIPRPETELLVEEALRWLGRWTEDRAPVVVDVGTGSGAIAVAVAVNAPSARIFAVDESAGALEVAAENAARYDVERRIARLHGSLLGPVPPPIDLLLANLPYIPSAAIGALAPEVRDYEPRLALDGGPTGLALVDALLEQAPGWLRPGGAILFEIGADEGGAAVALAAQHFSPGAIRLIPDLAKHDRIVAIQT